MKTSRAQSAPATIDAIASDWVIRREAGLTIAQEDEFVAWRDADPRHAEAVARHTKVWQFLDRPRTGGRAPEMLAALSARTKHRRHTRLATAAAIVLLGLGTWWSLRPAPAANPARATVTVTAPTLRTLPDGSIVELRSGTTITVDYEGIFRRVTLQKGEALFQVAKNKERPFIVTGGGVDVRAVGTAFLVGVENKQVDVIVTEGRVAVASPAALFPPVTMAETPTLVDAGKRLLVEPHSGRPFPQEAVAISAEEIARRLAWRETWLEFSYTPLSEVVATMNRHADKRLVIKDRSLDSLPVTGLFRANNAETLVRLLEANFGIEAERTDDMIVLRKAR